MLGLPYTNGAQPRPLLKGLPQALQATSPPLRQDAGSPPLQQDAGSPPLCQDPGSPPLRQDASSPQPLLSLSVQVAGLPQSPLTQAAG